MLCLKSLPTFKIINLNKTCGVSDINHKILLSYLHIFPYKNNSLTFFFITF